MLHKGPLWDAVIDIPIHRSQKVSNLLSKKATVSAFLEWHTFQSTASKDNILSP